MAGYYKNSAGAIRAALWSGTKSVDLGTLGGTESKAYSINADGDIVGYAETKKGAHDAFLYSNGLMIDLNQFLPANTAWQLTDAFTITDKGWIVGSATFHGETHAYILKPKGARVPSILPPSPSS